MIRTQAALDYLLPVVEKFPKTGANPYNLVGYASRLHQLDVVENWLKKAMAVDHHAVKQTALEDGDLKPLWDSLGW